MPNVFRTLPAPAAKDKAGANLAALGAGVNGQGGLIELASSGHDEPFHVARVFAEVGDGREVFEQRLREQ